VDEAKCRSKLATMIDDIPSAPKQLPSFTEVIMRCQEMLEKIMSSLSRPLLLEVAQQVGEEVESQNTNVQSSDLPAAQSSPAKSPSKLEVPCSNITGAITLDTSKQAEQRTGVIKSPEKRSRQSNAATESERRKTVDHVPSTSRAVDNISEVETSDESDTDGIHSEDRWHPKSKCTKKIKKVWSSLEEEMVYVGVKAHGVGNWALIHANYLPSRTNVDIKDKWRTMLRQGRLKELARQFGPLPLI